MNKKKNKSIQFLRYEEVEKNKWDIFFLYKKEPFILKSVMLKKRKGKEVEFVSDRIVHNDKKSGHCKLCKNDRAGECLSLEEHGEKIIKKLLTRTFMISLTLLANKENLSGLTAEVSKEENLEKAIKIKGSTNKTNRLYIHFIYLKKEYCLVEKNFLFFKKTRIYEGSPDNLISIAYSLEQKKVIKIVKNKKEGL